MIVSKFQTLFDSNSNFKTFYEFFFQNESGVITQSKILEQLKLKNCEFLNESGVITEGNGKVKRSGNERHHWKQPSF